MTSVLLVLPVPTLVFGYCLLRLWAPSLVLRKTLLTIDNDFVLLSSLS